MEQSGVEFTEMMSGVKVDDKSIVTLVTPGKESGVSIVILKMYNNHLHHMQLHGIAGRIGRGLTGSTKPKTKKIELANNKTAQVSNYIQFPLTLFIQ